MSKKKRGGQLSSGSHRQPDGNDYEVGYCRPPKHSQFKPGQSGNRRGRPKSSQNLATIARRRFAQKIPMREAGKVRKVVTLEAGVARLIERALRGDHRAMMLFFNLARSVEVPETDRMADWKAILPLLSDEELEFLGRIVTRYESKLNEEKK